MNEIILIGAGGHTSSCIDVIELAGEFKIAGLIEKENRIKEVFGYPVIGSDKDLSDLSQRYKFALITVGQIKSVAPRIKLFNLLLNLGYKLPTIISPKAYVSKNSKIEMGTIVMHDVIINANSKIGKNCIINTKALIEHDSVVEDHCHISTGAIINGGVKIGSESFIGSGVITKESISIGKNCVIGFGSVIKNDINNNQTVRK